MAENIKKLKYEPGDNLDTTQRPMTCPNGHLIQTRVTRKSGHGRVFCATCGWNDAQVVVGADPLMPDTQIVSQRPRPAHRQQGGVTVMSSAGIENRSRPNIVSR